MDKTNKNNPHLTLFPSLDEETESENSENEQYEYSENNNNESDHLSEEDISESEEDERTDKKNNNNENNKNDKNKNQLKGPFTEKQMAKLEAPFLGDQCPGRGGHELVDVSNGCIS